MHKILWKKKRRFLQTLQMPKRYMYSFSSATFNTSETIWFKAIVTDVLSHRPTTKSGVLHVELIDPLNNRIVDKNLLKISEGIASGFFSIAFKLQGRKIYGQGIYGVEQKFWSRLH